MPDRFTPAERSAVMRAVKSTDTSPELVVRRIAHALGFRYRLHDRRLPGSPDLVFAGRRKVIFVHGCFWHRHRCPAGRSLPATRQDYWTAKFARNVARDRRHTRALQQAGWRVLVVWECQTRRAAQARLRARLERFLASY